MSEPDERRIAELAKKPPRVFRGGASAQALQEARRVLETQALISRQQPGGRACDD
ncbi:hypothetical protein ACFYZ5_27660 [Streptomyces chartreusis]|uniref:hypothetical protein n=1 Tax=Streptomyces chartreusis TaxID=1969 RepID=UPI0036A3F33E